LRRREKGIEPAAASARTLRLRAISHEAGASVEAAHDPQAVLSDRIGARSALEAEERSRDVSSMISSSGLGSLKRYP
jgi:hypothetical protein